MDQANTLVVSHCLLETRRFDEADVQQLIKEGTFENLVVSMHSCADPSVVEVKNLTHLTMSFCSRTKFSFVRWDTL